MASKSIAIILLFNIVFYTAAKADCSDNDLLQLIGCGNVSDTSGPSVNQCCNVLTVSQKQM
ncbi:hypothetical protein DY000_02026774 [Brassica cretica]|uniref:Hydrophobic seed protein domain-containing protein n=1 Tax=Brassica cretica TaxID=69181 RepID=A0ABQ7E7W2_BRACR|nr:hypothetical protein DY000_02026774 [Brassica cretica]